MGLLRSGVARTLLPALLRRARLVPALLAACADPSSSSALERIDPPRGLNDRRTPIALMGRDLAPPLAEEGADLAAHPWDGEVGGRALGKMTWISSEHLVAEVPVGLPEGTYDVVLRSSGREVRLRSGFTAVTPLAPRLDAAEPSAVSTDGGRVVLRGIGLHYGCTVRMGTAGDASSLVEVTTRWLDDLSIEIAVPSRGPGSVRLEVETPVGYAWRDGLLTYRAP